MAREKPLTILWAWLGWWRIRHTVLRRVNFGLTPVVGIVGGLIVMAAPRNLNIFGNNGAVLLFNGLLQMLAGFFVASLAAVATFNRPSLDEVMGGIPPSLINSNTHDLESFTRRRFLTMLFGYLSGLSIILYLIGSIAAVAAPVLSASVSGSFHATLRVVFGVIYSASFGNIVFTSFIGLYFLIDRMHHDTPPSGFLDLPSGDEVSDEDQIRR